MTVTMTIAAHTSATVAENLRNQVRDRFEEEYLGLRDIERPALVEMLDTEDAETDLAKVLRAITIIDYQLAAIRDFLGSEPKASSRQSVGVGSCVCLDLGEGPRWFLLAALPFDDPRVIASDSALGRAVLRARPRDAVVYPTPAGLKTARIIAVDPAVS
jgi:transcription elongation GreA/GreB family factor